MKEKIVYQAIDGNIFETKDECEAYETDHCAVMMFDVYGRRVNDIQMAQFIYLRDENAANTLIKSVQWQEDICGIAAGDIGLFVWDVDRDEYRQIVVSQLHILNQLVNMLF